MDASSTRKKSSFPRSQSEMCHFRSFRATHHCLVDASLLPITNSCSCNNYDSDNHHVEAYQDSQLNLNGDHAQSIHPPHPRRIIDIATTKISSASVVDDVSAALPRELPSFPFTENDGDGAPSQPQRNFSRGHSNTNTKVQRQYSPVNANVAHEMVTRLASEKLYERRRSIEMEVGMSKSYYPGRRDSFTFENWPHRSFSDRAAAEDQHINAKVLRKDYALGTAVRSPHHMITKPTHQRATESINSLKKHDFAFVKRSDGSFCYAILARRSEDCLVFIVNVTGSTKIIRKKYWSAFVRLVSMEGLDPCPLTYTATIKKLSHSTCPNWSSSKGHYLKEHSAILCQDDTPPVICQEIGTGDDCAPISSIVFDRHMDDECSLISNVSDRAMCLARQRNLTL